MQCNVSDEIIQFDGISKLYQGCFESAPHCKHTHTYTVYDAHTHIYTVYHTHKHTNLNLHFTGHSASSNADLFSRQDGYNHSGRHKAHCDNVKQFRTTSTRERQTNNKPTFDESKKFNERTNERT